MIIFSVCEGKINLIFIELTKLLTLKVDTDNYPGTLSTETNIIINTGVLEIKANTGIGVKNTQ